MKQSKIWELASRVFRFANTDFDPKISRCFDWLRHPVAWIGLAAVFSLLAGVLVGPQGYIIGCSLLGLLALGLAWPWISMKGIRCRLIIPQGRFWEDEELIVEFEVQNFWPLPIYGLMVEGDFLQSIGADEEPIAFSLSRVRAWSSTRFQIPVVPRRRGQLPSGPVQIKNGFPFGLIDICREVHWDSPCLVWPKRLTAEGQPMWNNSRDNVFGVFRDVSGNQGDTIGVRNYSYGDRLRNIHWAQSVRSQGLMVRERQTKSTSDSTILLDLSPANHAGVGINSSYEWAIRIAGTISYQLHQAQGSVRLVCLGISDEADRADNRHGIRTLMNFLSCLPAIHVFSESLESEGPSNPKQRLPQTSQQTFFIGTNRTRIPCESIQESNRIVIHVDGFDKDAMVIGNRSKTGNTAVELNLSRKNGIVVTAPDAAGEQFETGWRGSVGNVTC